MNDKKENFTFHIDSKIMEIIKNRSKMENVSVNHYVNHLLRFSALWNVHAPSAGWIPMPKQILLALIDKFTEDELLELANKKGKEIAQDILLFIDGRYDVDSWINFIKIRAAAAGFSYSEQIENNTTKCIIYHGMGKKWSAWFANFYKTVFDDLKKHATFEVGENTMCINITR